MNYYITILSCAFVCFRYQQMNTGKGTLADSSVVPREFTKWTEEMDEKLLNAIIDEARLGNRVDGSWTTQAYNNMVLHLHESGFTTVTKTM